MYSDSIGPSYRPVLQQYVVRKAQSNKLNNLGNVRIARQFWNVRCLTAFMNANF